MNEGSTKPGPVFQQPLPGRDRLACGDHGPHAFPAMALTGFSRRWGMPQRPPAGPLLPGSLKIPSMLFRPVRSTPPSSGLLKNPVSRAAAWRIMRRGRARWFCSGTTPPRGRPAFRGRPSSGQVRRPQTILLGCPATANNSMIGIPSLLGGAFSTAPSVGTGLPGRGEGAFPRNCRRRVFASTGYAGEAARRPPVFQAARRAGIGWPLGRGADGAKCK